MQIEDESLHIPSRDRHWNESLYFNFISDDNHWGGAVRLGYSPNSGNKDGFIIFYFPDGKHGFIRTAETLTVNDLQVGPITFECIEPFRKWRIKYKGPIFVFDDPSEASEFIKTMMVDLPKREVAIDLLFECFHEPFDFHVAMKKRLLSRKRIVQKLKPNYLMNHLPILPTKLKILRTMGNAHHYEQGGLISGSIIIDKEEFSFSGSGQRDHSWGVRDMRVPTQWQWFSCQFAEELAFNATRVEVLSMEAIGGHVYYKGRCHALRDWILEADYDATGQWAKQFHLTLMLDSGETLQINGTANASFPVRLTTEGLTAQVNESLAQFSWQGKTRSGIAEFMSQVYPN